MNSPIDQNDRKDIATSEGKDGSRRSFEAECERLRALLADQLERDALREARSTVTALLCLNPSDSDALGVRAFLDEQLAQATTHPVGEIRRFTDHQSAVNCVAFSPDGRMALSCSGGKGTKVGESRSLSDHTVRLWDLDSVRELRRMAGHVGAVTSAVFSADGRRIFSGSLEGGMNLWDAETGRLLRTIGRHLKNINAVAFSPDGQSVLSASDDGLVRSWSVEDGERLARFEGHRKHVAGVTYSADGQWILSGGADRTVRLWDASKGQLIRKFEGHREAVTSVAFSADGRLAVSSSADFTARVWDLETGRERCCFAGHSFPVNSVAISPDSQRVLTAGSDCILILWDVASACELHRFQGHTDVVKCVVFSADGMRALSGGRDTTARIWQLPGALVSPLSSDSVDELEIPRFRSVADFVHSVCLSQVLAPAQEEELKTQLQSRYTAPISLVRHLVERGWLTSYQVQLLVEKRESELRLGPYVLLGQLGAGGMGQVFNARRIDAKEVVALKVVQPELMENEEAVQQFWWEIKVLTSLQHPNIIKTLDSGQDRGTNYFTMELIEGIDLGRLLNQFGPLPITQACDYIRQAALGLEHAHERCLIHRDIKPQNLLLTLPPGTTNPNETGRSPTGPTAVIKVLDWGLAGLRLPKGSRKVDGDVPREESTGTADYLSPEQAFDASTADIRADIYSLGCTLYHLLAGKAPFHGGSFIQKLFKHQTQEPPPIESLRPDVPKGLCTILKKTMAKSPDDRYRSPAALAGALAPFCKGI